MQPLSQEELTVALERLAHWTHHDDHLCRRFELQDFPQALAFMVRVGFEAERMHHHPEFQNVYSKVRVALTTHDAGNKVTERDVELAQAIDRVYQSMRPVHHSG